ncbi:tetratricopeptide (TPR) repeat protein [Arthrobacter sp. UYP6]|uniref:hypothetical protein n=1 Tax=Arthrobacter sp. UYP6 TaxID=1756378 RepID=UPI003393FD8A
MENSLDYMINEYSARQFWERREYKDAMEQAAVAAEKALGTGDKTAYLRTSLLMAECQLEMGLIQEFAISARQLAEDSSIRSDPAMEARAKALYARALHALGLVGEALSVAQEAAAIDVQEGSPEQSHFDTHHALVASLAECGDLPGAWVAAKAMEGLITPHTPAKIAGLAHWAIGNVAFLMDERGLGVKHHDLASEMLSPSNDVNLWALFNKGSAHVRLDAGLLEPSTLVCIERAELAISVTGGSPIDELEIALARAHWLLLTGEPQESVDRLSHILEQRDLLPTHTLAETEYLLALALFELRRYEDALQAVQHSEKTFIILGAGRKAENAHVLIDSIEALNG